MKPVKITIVGGGFGGIYALKKFHKLFHGNKNIKITLVNEKNYFLFTPLLHEVATGGVNAGNIVESIRKILGCCVETLHIGKVTNIDLKNHKLEMATGTWDFDYLVLAPGAETNFYDIPGAEENSFTLKTLDDAVRLKDHLITLVDQASFVLDRKRRSDMLRFIVVGGGPTGVELAAELQEFLKKTFSRYYPEDLIEDISVIIVQKTSDIVPQFSELLRKKSLEILQKKGLEILFNTEVKEVTKEEVKFSIGNSLKTKTVVWTAGVKPANISFAEKVEKEMNGRLKVNQYLQLEKYPFVYAVGDVAGVKSEDGSFFSALAQVAVKEAEIAVENIKNQIEGQALKSFMYKNEGTLVSLGKWMAAGEIFGFNFSGHFAWWVWRTVYLFKLVSWQKKARVALDWTLTAFSARDISEL